MSLEESDKKPLSRPSMELQPQSLVTNQKKKRKKETGARTN
jgi:hypothetical protein